METELIGEIVQAERDYAAAVDQLRADNRDAELQRQRRINRALWNERAVLWAVDAVIAHRVRGVELPQHPILRAFLIQVGRFIS